MDAGYMAIVVEKNVLLKVNCNLCCNKRGPDNLVFRASELMCFIRNLNFCLQMKCLSAGYSGSFVTFDSAFATGLDSLLNKVVHYFIVGALSVLAISSI